MLNLANQQAPVLIKYLNILQISICILVWFLVLFVINRPLPDYYAVHDNYLFLGSPIGDNFFVDRPVNNIFNKIVTLNQPIKSVEQISDLSASIVASSLTLDFVHYYQQLASIKKHFTESGWKSFGDSLLTSGFLDAVLEKKLSISCVVTGKPILLNRGILSGSYAWRFQMPILITFESASEKKNINKVVTITFKRVSLNGDGALVGVAVDSFITSD